MPEETWKELISAAERELSAAGISDSKLNAELLAAHVLGVWSRSEVRERIVHPASEEENNLYRFLLHRRLQHEPLQYITGETEFFGLRLFTTPAALIPRPDTEILVEEVLKVASRFAHPRILDVGTGTGCIPLAVASKNTSAEMLGIDISNDAIALAQRNKARFTFGNVAFRHADLFSDSDIASLGRFDIIVSNPPYIPIEEYEDLDEEVRNFEPPNALMDKADGLAFYKRLAEVAAFLLTPGGHLLTEVGDGAVEAVRQIFARLGQISIVRDLAGIERVVAVQVAGAENV